MSFAEVNIIRTIVENCLPYEVAVFYFLNSCEYHFFRIVMKKYLNLDYLVWINMDKNSKMDNNFLREQF